MKKLLRGIVEFRRRLRPEYRATFARLALGQSPDALLVACSDSRVAVNVFASTEPGDLFVVRNPGNLIAPCGPDGRSVNDESEAAAIEFATLALGVGDMIVCGHSECGAMQALLTGRAPEGAQHLATWIRHGGPALAALRREAPGTSDLKAHNRLSQLNVLAQVEHLRTYQVVRDRERDGRLRLHAWWFDIAQAEVQAYDAQAGRFAILDEAEAARILERLGG